MRFFSALRRYAPSFFKLIHRGPHAIRLSRKSLWNYPHNGAFPGKLGVVASTFSHGSSEPDLTYFRSVIQEHLKDYPREHEHKELGDEPSEGADKGKTPVLWDSFAESRRVSTVCEEDIENASETYPESEGYAAEYGFEERFAQLSLGKDEHHGHGQAATVDEQNGAMPGSKTGQTLDIVDNSAADIARTETSVAGRSDSANSSAFRSESLDFKEGNVFHIGDVQEPATVKDQIVEKKCPAGASPGDEQAVDFFADKEVEKLVSGRIAQSLQPDLKTTPFQDLPFHTDSPPTTHPDSDSTSKLVSDLSPGPRRRTSKAAYRLSAYVNDSPVLQGLLQLGVDLARAEKLNGAANLLVRVTMEEHVKPVFEWLRQLGFEDSDAAVIVSKNPFVLGQRPENLEVKANYFRSKKFPREAILRILFRSPKLLTDSVRQIDTRLGYLQREFGLTGDQVRYVVSQHSLLVTADISRLRGAKFGLRERMGFTEEQCRYLLLRTPGIYCSSRRRASVESTFDYLFNIMEINRKQILEFPQLLRLRRSVLADRHEYLVHVGRAKYGQYGADGEGMPFETLVIGPPRWFCEKAGIDWNDFTNFLRNR